MVCCFLNIFFELLIIKHLDPFYLISIDSAFFLFTEVIDYSITFSQTNKYRDAKFAFVILCDGISIILCSIHLEIIELHFCGLDQYLRRYITKREIQDKSFIVLQDIYEDRDDIYEN